MKTKLFLITKESRIIAILKGIILLFLIMFTSCTITKRKYEPGYYITWNHKSHHEEQQINKKCPVSKNRVLIDNTRSFTPDVNPLPLVASIDSKTIESVVTTPKFNYPYDTTKCDEITLLNGDYIDCKVEEISLDIIRYRNCDNLSGPLIDIEKSKVFFIRYANGTRTVINAAKEQNTMQPTPAGNDYPKYSPANNGNSQPPKSGRGLATAALICGIVAFVASYGSFVLGLLALIFGASALSRIKKSEDKKGKGSATAGLVLGIIAMALWTIILLGLLTV
jgi:hypothetical protein